jgi:transposase InsO family protein
MWELALRWPRYGYRMIACLLQKEGWRVNVKRVHRLWKKEGLQVRKKQVKKRRETDEKGKKILLKKAEWMDHVWSFDFCMDRTSDGRMLKIFSVIDEFTRRCLVIEVEHRMTGEAVVRILKGLMKVHGEPGHVRSDNGPEFVCKALERWLEKRCVSALFIAKGSPWENGYVESYHARLRDELLNREEFGSLWAAKGMLGNWREEYNDERPHSALGYKTPAAFAAACRAQAQLRCAPLGLGTAEEEVLTGGSVAQRVVQG